MVSFWIDLRLAQCWHCTIALGINLANASESDAVPSLATDDWLRTVARGSDNRSVLQGRLREV